MTEQEYRSVECRADEIMVGDLIGDGTVSKVTSQQIMTHSPYQVRVYLDDMTMPMHYFEANDVVWVNRPIRPAVPGERRCQWCIDNVETVLGLKIEPCPHVKEHKGAGMRLTMQEDARAGDVVVVDPQTGMLRKG